MDNFERERYLKAYYDNEYDANRQMGFANLFAAVALLVVWILYLTRAFIVDTQTFVLLNIIIPISLVILVAPMVYVLWFKDRLRKPTYKYFVIFSFLLVIVVLNIIVPKHGIIGWALVVALTTHYYNPKLGRITFILTLIFMPISMYLGMFFGEYDPNLLGKGFINGDNIDWPRDALSRLEMLNNMIAQGENRYVKVLLYYYLPRGMFVTLIYLVIDALNKRTYKLFVEEFKINSEQERTKTELEVAKDIQIATLPTSFITTEDVEIQAELKAAKEVGGDFYDYFVLDDDNVAIVIGDVSGKGIPAAMFMMKTITCFKNYVFTSKSPSEIIKKVNKTIFQGNESKMFVTCFLAIVNIKNGHVRYANAGHNKPIIGSPKRYRYLDCKSGFILGVMEDTLVSDETFVLQKGETITLYTDGITEAMNKKRQLYGEDRLINVFNKYEYSTLVELHHSIKDDVAQFVQDAPQSDDMTYITLKYHGDKCVYEERTFEGTKEEVPNMLAFLKEFGEKQKLDQSYINNGLIIGDELLSNIVKYGYKDYEGQIFIRLLYNLGKKEFIATFIDTGIQFNPFTVDNKPLSGDISDRAEGGLGILIVKTLLSEYAYDYINGKNIVVLKKKF